MISTVQITCLKELGDIRTVVDDGILYFPVNDILRILKLKRRTDNKIKRIITSTSKMMFVKDNICGFSGCNTFIPEHSVYQLIFLSEQEDAIKFTHTMCSAIIPKLRSAGEYVIGSNWAETIATNDASQQESLVFKELKDFMEAIEPKYKVDKGRLEMDDIFSKLTKVYPSYTYQNIYFFRDECKAKGPSCVEQRAFNCARYLADISDSLLKIRPDDRAYFNRLDEIAFSLSGMEYDKIVIDYLLPKIKIILDQTGIEIPSNRMDNKLSIEDPF